MPLYREIEDVGLLKKYSDELTKKISLQASHKKVKTVGYPSGREDFPINFEFESGTNVRWWSSRSSQNNEAIINLIGRGDPNGNEYLLIDLQFNIPVKKFGRSHGGAFVQDLDSGGILLAHRGIVTRGKSRVPKSELIKETLVEASAVLNSSGGTDLFLVASLDSESLLDDISNFAQEMRRAAGAVMGDVQVGPLRKFGSSGMSNIDQKVNDYFDEFVGKKKLPSRKATIVVVRHGSVVKRLAELFSVNTAAYKSKFVDLVVVAANQIYLFEVKTSLDTSSIYTAIGQLSLHAIAVSEQFHGKVVHQIMVVPGAPSPRLRKILWENLKIKILSYEWDGTRPVIFDESDLELACRCDE